MWQQQRCTHELTETGAACTGLSQDQASPDPSVDGGGTHEVPLFS